MILGARDLREVIVVASFPKLARALSTALNLPIIELGRGITG